MAKLSHLARQGIGRIGGYETSSKQDMSKRGRKGGLKTSQYKQFMSTIGSIGGKSSGKAGAAGGKKPRS